MSKGERHADADDQAQRQIAEQGEAKECALGSSVVERLCRFGIVKITSWNKTIWSYRIRVV